jgi:imidazolonepropionase-like amidohydrolase
MVRVRARLAALAAFAAASLLLFPSAALPRAARPGGPRAIVLRHASVIPMNSERVVTGRTIVVEDGRVTVMGPDGTFPVPSGAVLYDAGGAYVVPGLIDMHVHVRSPDLGAYLDNGVTSVRNMWGFAALPALIAQIESGEVEGPTVYSASPGLDATPVSWPQTQIVEDPSLADSVVAAQVAAGWRFLKIYNRLSPDVFDAIFASARTRGIRVVGHVPFAVSVEHALDSGMASIEHLTGYGLAVTTDSGASPAGAWVHVDASRMPGLAARTASAGTWNCPTMSVIEVITRSSDPATRAATLANRALMVGALRDAGARLLAGTDSGIGYTAPGESIHDELADLVAAGLTPYEALRAATSGAAEFLEEQADVGTLAVGRRADLLVVAGNPLADVSVLRHPALVMRRGVWHVPGATRSPQAPQRSGRSPREVTRPHED